MSNPPDDSGRESGAVPGASASGIASIERAFLRLTFWQTLLSLAGVFTGAVALYAALNESQAVRQQTAASVWPYVQVIMHDTDNGEQASFALSFDNVGVGPARIMGVEVQFAGAAVPSWTDATGRVLDEPAQVGVDFGRSSLRDRVIAPGASVEAFTTDVPDLARAMQAAVYAGDTSVRYCFCSIFDDCWLGQVLAEPDGPAIRVVEACPDFGQGAFLD